MLSLVNGFATSPFRDNAADCARHHCRPGSVGAEMAVRLARAFNTTPQFWLKPQANHTVWEVELMMKVVIPITGCHASCYAPSFPSFMPHECGQRAISSWPRLFLPSSGPLMRITLDFLPSSPSTRLVMERRAQISFR